MDQISMAGELAWLIKDNLHCKHLILAAEEKFIEFLESSSSPELELEPMISYHRMLLHRLADIFGLDHESVGEGDDRHLIVERCEDSSIPPVLVSDILDWQYGETQSHQATCQLLKRKITLTDLQPKQLANQLPSLSFEEREAAYLAARERIFSSSSDEIDEPKEQATPRPRTVPVVARRMIAHALGKRIIVDSTCEKPEVPKDVDVPQADEKMTDKCLNGASSHVESQLAAIASFEETPAAAAKKMINKYLNGGAPGINGKTNEKVDTNVTSTDMKMVQKNLSYSTQDVSGPTIKDGLENTLPTEGKSKTYKSLNSETLCVNEKMIDKNMNTRMPSIDEKLPEKTLTNSSQFASVGQQPGKSTLGHMPAAAAKRMFAQALGLPLANGSSKTALESTSRLGSGSSNVSDPGIFEVDSSCQNASQFSVSVAEERNSCVASTGRPEELHDSRAHVEPPSTSQSPRILPHSHSSTRRMPHTHIPGKAAQRLFVQALGIQSVSSTCIEGNLIRNSTASSPSLRGLKIGHKPTASFRPSNAGHNSLASSSVMTNSIIDETKRDDTKSNICLSLASDVKGKNISEAMVSVELDPCESVDRERETSGQSPKQLGDKCASSKESNNFQVKANNTTPKSYGRPRRMNNPGPVKAKNSNYKITRTCSSDKTSMISL